MMAKTLETVVREIAKNILPAANLLDKAKAVYDWVSENIKYDHKRRNAVENDEENSDPRPPRETLRKGKGICSDHARLYIELAARFGIHAEMAYIKMPDGTGHACAAIPWKKSYFLVDTGRSDGFGVNYDNYEFIPRENYEQEDWEEQEEDEEACKVNRRAQNQSIYQNEKEAKELVGKIASIGALVASGLVALWMLVGQDYVGDARRKTIQVIETSGAVTFQTQKGSIRYDIAPDARKEWQRLLFFEEVRLSRGLSNREKFELCEKADRIKEENRNGERELSLEEITNARQEAERNARQH